MTLTELIAQLQNLRDQHGNLPVLTRGSTPAKMTDATEVRKLKTTRRDVVFIGKPKSEVEA